MHLLPLLVAGLTATSLAAPTFFDDLYDYSDDMAGFLGRVSKHIEDAKDLFTATSTCDPSNIALPAYASGLPSPTDQRPLYVALGRGTQVRYMHHTYCFEGSLTKA